MSTPNNQPTPEQPAPARTITPEQALENLAMLAADYALKARERDIINHSILVLREVIAELQAAKAKSAPPNKREYVGLRPTR